MPELEPGAAASLVDHLRAVQASEQASFHMPGHKGGSGVPAAGLEVLGQAAYAADLSELAGFDYLHGASTGIAAAQARAAKLLGADRTWFLVNGATVGNLAAVVAIAGGDGEAILVARASHRSVYAGVSLAGAWPTYLPPVRNDTLDGLFGIDVAAVESALSRNRQIRAVHVTSPSYYGFTIDVAAIAEIAREHEVPLIVDEAHGTHWALHPSFPRPALACGADVVVHSPHKTLGSLTQTSLLHVQGSLVDAGRIDAQLQMLQSSSPSAVLMLSLDIALEEMARSGRERWGGAIALADEVRGAVREIRGITAYGREIAGTPGIHDYDPTKLVVDVHELHITGHAAARWLREHRGINPEFADLRRMVFSVTPGDTQETTGLLVAGLEALAATGGGTEGESHITSLWPSEVPEAALTPREGATMAHLTVPTDEAIGLESAEMIVPYPPGVPLLVAGELISTEVVESMRQLLAAGCRMVGLSDPTGKTLRCVDD